MPRNRRNRCGRLGARVIDSSNPASGSSAGNLNPPVGLDRSAGNLEIRPRNEIIVQFHCFIIPTILSFVHRTIFLLLDGIVTIWSDNQIFYYTRRENTFKNNFLK